MRHVSMVVFVLSLSVAACSSGSKAGGSSAPAVGAERGDCRHDRTCDPGLTCLSNLCVRPPPADCTKVADALGPIFLDNYTPREQRDAFAAEVKQACAGLTREDGECLARARSRQDVAACPHPIGLGSCKAILAHAEELRAKSGVDAYLVTPADRLVERCKSESPTRAFEQCALAATSMDDLARCAW